MILIIVYLNVNSIENLIREFGENREKLKDYWINVCFRFNNIKG